MVRLRTVAVALLDCASNGFADWPVPFAIRRLPRQAVLFARCADDALGVLVDLVALTLLERVFVLRVDVAAADRDRVQFGGPDASIQQLATAGFRIERPCRTALHDRNRERPVLVADEQKGGAPGFRIHRPADFFRSR